MSTICNVPGAVVEPAAEVAVRKNLQTLVVVPFYNRLKDGDPRENGREFFLLEKSLASLAAQTNKDFLAVVVEDHAASLNPADPAFDPDMYEHLHDLQRHYSKEMPLQVMVAGQNGGLGASRMAAVNLALKAGIPRIALLDHDDEADPKMIAEANKAFEDENITGVYSSYEPTCDEGKPLAPDQVNPDVLAHIAFMERNAPEGRSIWKSNFGEDGSTGYLMLPSTLVTYAELFAKHPHRWRVNEDSEAMPGLSEDAVFRMIDAKVKYRMVPGDSASRDAFGPHFFNTSMACREMNGLRLATNMALRNGRATHAEVAEIRERYLNNSIERRKANRPEIAAAFEDILDNSSLGHGVIDMDQWVAKVNWHAERLGVEPTEVSTLVRAELDEIAAGVHHDITYHPLGRTPAESIGYLADVTPAAGPLHLVHGGSGREAMGRAIGA